jgi:hypothetical protein
MRILFDQGTPVPLRQHLTRHVVDTAFERGWSSLHNGELLDVAEHEGYDLLITTDQNLRYQQHLADRQLAIIVLLSTSWPRIQLRIDTIQAAVERIMAKGVPRNCHLTKPSHDWCRDNMRVSVAAKSGAKSGCLVAPSQQPSVGPVFARNSSTNPRM